MNEQEIPYGQVERDLNELVKSRVSEAILSVLQLAETTGQSYLVTLTAANQAVGMWAGVFGIHHNLTAAEELSQPEALEALAAVIRESSDPEVQP